MSRAALAPLVLLLLASPALSEVSVLRDADGRVELFFEPGPGGPWEAVRADVPAGDRLNDLGDHDADSWPVILVNGATGLPDVAWSRGGADREIVFATHDGTEWSSPINVSRGAGNDDRPVLDADPAGNRFIAWTRSTNSRHLVLFAASSGRDGALSPALELSDRHDDARRAAIAAHAGAVFVAYEERRNGNLPIVHLAVDLLSVSRDGDGYLMHAGERPIDIARVLTLATPGPPDHVLKQAVRSEDGHLWVAWLDEPGRLGWVELVDGSFTDTKHLDVNLFGGESAAREAVRAMVLAD